MAPRTTRRSKKAAGLLDGEEQPVCIICMNAPSAGEGEHHCTTCAPRAWLICAQCEEAIKGKRCPVCRADYMREPSSAWESLPSCTTTLTLDAQPTQDELKRLAVRFARLEVLEIDLEYEDGREELDFASGVRFPALTTLTLSCVGLRSVTFTEANTPVLEHLSLSNIIGQVCPFQLALPRLSSFSAEHTMLGERYVDAGQFGLSLSRCPSLESVHTYKFRCLGDTNYAVLPSLRSLMLHRSECTTHLDILYAPELREVSLQAAYELRGFKLRNIPSATLATVEALLSAKAEAEEGAREEARVEDARWRVQSRRKALTKEAVKRGWIDEGERWSVRPAPPGEDLEGEGSFLRGRGDEEYEEMLEEILAEHIDSIFEERVGAAVKAAEARILSASVEDDSRPRCTIDVTNMDGFRLSSLEPQLRGRCKVHESSGGDMPMFCSGGSDDDDDDDDDDDAFGPRQQFMQMMQMMRGASSQRGAPFGGPDPRDYFMQMMMQTGMPQLEGILMPRRVEEEEDDDDEDEDEEEDEEEEERESQRKKGKRPKEEAGQGKRRARPRHGNANGGTSRDANSAPVEAAYGY